MGKENKLFSHVYPVIRVDGFQFKPDRVADIHNIPSFVKVVSVFDSEDQAQEEVDRLNALNGKTGDVLYFYDVTRHKVSEDSDNSIEYR